MSHCGQYLASCALDDMVKIFDVSNLADRPVDGTFDLDAYERSIEDKLVANHGKLPIDNTEEQKENNGEMMDEEESKKPTGGNDENDWSDADSDDDDDDDSDDNDSDMSDGRRHKKKDKKLNPKTNTVGLSKKMLDKEKRMDFFKDM